MEIDASVTAFDVSEMFIEISKADDEIAKNVNAYMCSDVCICPGIFTDAHVEAYSKQSIEERLNKYGRTNVGYDGTIDLQRFTSDANKPLFWTYDPSSQNTEKEDLKKLSSNSMIECLDNMDAIA